MNELSQFARRVAELNLTEVECGIALLWFFDFFSPGAERSARELAEEMKALSLKGTINISRFSANLAKSKSTVRGSQKDRFRINLKAKTALDERFNALLKTVIPPVDDTILIQSDFEGTRKYLLELVREINGSFQFALYNSCLVMCRRLAEILLIEAFEKAGKADAIKKDGDYISLGDMIDVAESGQPLKLQRGTARLLRKVKELGDSAAHHRTYSSRLSDVDEIKSTYRRSIAELMSLSGYEV